MSKMVKIQKFILKNNTEVLQRIKKSVAYFGFYNFFPSLLTLNLTIIHKTLSLMMI